MSWHSFEAVTVLAIALLVDRFVGEPPTRLHPVVGIGATISALMRFAPRRGPVAQSIFGAALALSVPAAVALASWGSIAALERWPLAQLAWSVFLLKSSLSLDGLRKAALRMRACLGSDVSDARVQLRDLCSRDASGLDAAQLAGATVESVAENTSDSFVAPLLYFGLFGPPGAAAYRAVNTLDSMIGYRGRYEYLGKASARFDDLLNLIPARLTALLLLVAAAIHGERTLDGARVLFRDRRQTESPNAGWPMAAMAGVLGVRLDKIDCYRLGDPHEALGAQTIERAWRVVQTAGWLFAFILAAALAWFGATDLIGAQRVAA